MKTHNPFWNMKREFEEFTLLSSPVSETQQSNQPPFLCDDTPRVVAQLWRGAPPLHGSNVAVEHGSHNVSRWMTWLPISLKNAAKCDKWYQLQNLSITESLNANGTWKKILVVQLQVCHDLSVEQKPRIKKTVIVFFSGRFCA